MFESGKKGAEKGADKSEATVAQPEPPAAAKPAFGEPVVRSSAGLGAAVIGPSIRIDGDLRGEEDLRIEGEVKGTVQLKGNSLVIGSEGRVKATVHAKTIEIEGLVEGDVYAVETIHIRKSAKVQGNITSPRVSLEDGAKFNGSIEMDAQAVEAAMGKTRGNVSELNSSKDSGQSSKPIAGGSSS